jgi:hypothetical protein
MLAFLVSLIPVKPAVLVLVTQVILGSFLVHYLPLSVTQVTHDVTGFNDTGNAHIAGH